MAKAALGPLRIIPSLKPFFLSKKLHLMLKGGRGSGKTKSIAIFLIELSRIATARFLCLRQFQSRISESVYTVLKQTVIEQGYESEFEILKSSIVNKNTGSEFLFMGMQRNILEIKGVEDISYCWIEEGEGLTKEQWEIISPTIRKEGSRILISFNPKYEEDFVLSELPRLLGDQLIIRDLQYLENPHLSSTMLAKINRLKESDYEAYRHIYLGEPLDSNENAIITSSSIRAVISDDIPQEQYDGPVVMGFDIADSGEDKCAVVVRQGNVVIHVEEWKGEVDGILKSVTKAYSIAKKHNVNHIVYDSIGVGASAGAKLTEIDSTMRHTGWNAGRSITNSRVANRRVEHTKIKNKDFYANVKAMAWWDVSRMIVNKDIHIDKNKIDNRILEQLVRELSTPMKDFDNNGRVKVESKSDLAKRGIPSHNIADAFILAFAGENQEGYSWSVFKK